MIIGVGFLLFCRVDGAYKIFTIEELRGKPSVAKEKGMISFPLETFKEEDVSFRETIQRLVSEEIGIPKNQAMVCGIFKNEFRLIPGRPDVSTFYGFGEFIGNSLGPFFPEDTDITFAGWKSPKELLEIPHKRVEVAPIIEHFMSQRFYQLLV